MLVVLIKKNRTYFVIGSMRMSFPGGGGASGEICISLNTCSAVHKPPAMVGQY